MKPSTKFFIHTFGCRCNQADSAAIRGKLAGQSLEEAESHLNADLVIVNTCTVTHRADQQARQAVRRFHRENASAKLVVTGCYAQRDPVELAALPGVDLVLGNADKDRIEEYIESNDESSGKIVRSPLSPDRDYLLARTSHHRSSRGGSSRAGRPSATQSGRMNTSPQQKAGEKCGLASMANNGGHTRPFVKLQDGCDARCSYCIVPSVRGPGRSASPGDVVEEIRNLVERGFQEIVITGVHLAAYGRKLKPTVKLANLIEGILGVSGLGRLRLSSIEPMRFDPKLVDLAAENPLFAPHFHIPLQSGSDTVLRRMRRPYGASDFRELISNIAAKIPRVGLGTDVMAGFPGESEEEFADTYRLIEKLPLTYLHVFPFSRREGTDAANLPDPVPPQLIRERALALRELSLAKNLAFRRRFLGQTLPAISLSREEGVGESIALTDNYIHTRITGAKVPPNQLIDIRIVQADNSCTIAEVA